MGGLSTFPRGVTVEFLGFRIEAGGEMVACRSRRLATLLAENRLKLCRSLKYRPSGRAIGTEPGQRRNEAPFVHANVVVVANQFNPSVLSQLRLVSTASHPTRILKAAFYPRW